MAIPTRTFVMSYTDKSLVVYSASFWIATQVITDLIDGGLTAVSWTGYTNMTDYLLKAAPIDQHTTQVTGAQYAATLSAVTASTVGQTLGDLNSQALVNWGLATLDTPGKNVDGTPTLDAQGQPVLVSFFQGATITLLA